MDTLQRDTAIRLIASIQMHPNGRRNAINWLIANGVRKIKGKETVTANSDNSGFIITQDLCVAIAERVLKP